MLTHDVAPPCADVFFREQLGFGSNPRVRQDHICRSTERLVDLLEQVVDLSGDCQVGLHRQDGA